ncbi:HEPN domain-containing protein [Sphingomonas faeni]|uniref:HEPN domain-containing protein n=1 Tax=Sphingomonas faeni TaxID=185950 RepID=UPI00334B866A
MQDEGTFKNMGDYMVSVLPRIDRVLAKRDTEFLLRPLEATVEFVLGCRVDESGERSRTAALSVAEIGSESFAILYARAENWYRDRFGDALDRRLDERISGVVEIAGSPFDIEVPTIRTRPGVRGETVWMSAPDGVRDDEDPLSWVSSALNLTPNERALALNEATVTAGRLRFIRTGLIGVQSGDDVLDGLRAGMLPRLKAAANMLLQPDPQGMQYAAWELQLACEKALKALAQQRHGRFSQTHDLFALFDEIDPAPPFDRRLLNRLPRWKDSANMRYGQGERISRHVALAFYRTALEVTAGAVRGMTRFDIGQAEFEIKRPPWFAVLNQADSGAGPVV